MKKSEIIETYNKYYDPLYENKIMNDIKFQQLIDDSNFQAQQILFESKKDKIDEAWNNVAEYFEEYGTPLTKSFNINKMVKEFDSDIHTITVLLCNMDNEKVMKQIAKGNYDNFDVFDSSLFNDSYEEVLEDLGISEDEDYQDDED